MIDIWNRRAYFLALFSEHLLISFMAVLLVAVFGIAIGVWVFYSKKSRALIMPTVNFLYTIPSIAMFGLLIPLVGIGLNNALIVLVLYGLLPIVRNTYSGFKEVPNQLVEAAKGLGSTSFQLFRKVYFPLALPSILSGLRVTTVMVIALAGLAALIGAGGLGQAIFRGLNTMNTPLIVAGSLGISIFAILGDKFIGVFERNNTLQHLVSGNSNRKQKRFIVLNISLLLLMILGSTIILNPFKSSQHKVIHIASKPTSEQFILGEILAQSIEQNTTISVERKFGIGGGTTNIHPAMVAGDIDLYVEYTGTAWMNVLKHKVVANEAIDFMELKHQYIQNYQFEWMGLLGFNNTYAIALSNKEAKLHNIVNCTDLVKYSASYAFGAEFDFFERPDAYQGLIKVYPYAFEALHEMDINLRYKAFEDGKVDVIDAFTTDAQIDALDLRVLVDDKHFFPDYKAGIIVRQATLKKYPEIRPLLNKLNEKITTRIMRKMNYEVEILKKNPQQVASEFLNTLNERS